MSVGGYILIYLAVYGPETKGGFGLEGKTKAVCGVGRTNYGGLRNVRPPIIDPLSDQSGIHSEPMLSSVMTLSGCKA